MNLFDLSKDVAVVIGGTGVLGGAIASGLAAASSFVTGIDLKVDGGFLAMTI